MNEEEINKQAKKLMEKFAKSLSKVKTGKIKNEEFKEGGFREEKEPLKTDSDFRKRMFENAKNKDINFIYAEKKKW